ncbi:MULTISPECIES: phage baseplate assembly protein V [unclassified Herbaspirillum]|uniref:phage baseplate assembly protein V n=1 Tax=unclassified Herbaspirillum TaxID=2624150 RepID=UPI000E2EA57A|nr:MULTISPECIES: phage baseplate assembly protein V [unclassified Herbaspirillum]RFB73818.1 phage baseplate assembly protein V [Herbaspirillum sp. 3R-3a1]TFI10371.1 phage baseplate assembly protein V [Herbaspirillum sp. 3R11]TFI16276.1 phage baseplate assembly protein V [Herbaspirillum sp. 3R-11]TFI28373.1 phage baseplate assembly protein V [Herbaspirillum sp. 3C11]
MSADTLLARCTVVLSNPKSKTQRLQVRVLAGETKDDMELFEQYGITSVPLNGAGGLALFFGGDRSHGVVIMPGDKRYRPTDLEPGELAIYTHEGAKIVMRKGKIIEVECDEYRVKTKVYSVEAEQTISLKSSAFDLAADTAKSSAALQAPDVVLGGKSMVSHRHNEHDGPQTGGPING